ncbi:PEGA domain-containing protein [Thermococcus sp.]
MRNLRSVMAVGFIISILMIPYAGAFSVHQVFQGSPLPNTNSDFCAEYFENGFWVITTGNYSPDRFFTKIINASINRVVLTLRESISYVGSLDGSRYLIIATNSPEASVRLYQKSGGTYTLVWKFSMGEHEGISALLLLKNKKLIIVATAEYSQGYTLRVRGIGFGGELKFVTDVPYRGSPISRILPLGGDRLLLIAPSLGGTYLAIIDESGKLIKSFKSSGPGVYLQGKYIMLTEDIWDNNSSQKIRSKLDVLDLNLTLRASIPLPFLAMDIYPYSYPIFSNNTLYLFRIERPIFGKVEYSLLEYKYAPDGTLYWRRKVQSLSFSQLPNQTGFFTTFIFNQSLIYPNVYVGLFPAGKVVNIIAVDFRNAIPLTNLTLPIPYDPYYKGFGFYYDGKYLYTWRRVDSLDFSEIPSAIFIDSGLPSNVTVDDKYRGSTPFYLRVTPGRHAVRIFRRDYEPVEKSVYIGPHEGVRVFADLKPLNATVFINSTPVARVQIVEKGTSVITPASISLPNGNYTLIVESRDYPAAYEQIVKTITLTPNETLDLNFNLSLVRSKLVVVSNVENASVYLDGKPMGKTPFIRFVRLGVHNITITAEGYVSKSLEINATRPLEKLVVNLTHVEKKTEVSNTTSSNTSTEVNTTATPSTISSHKLSTTSPENSGSICGPGLVVLLPLLALFLRRKRGV